MTARPDQINTVRELMQQRRQVAAAPPSRTPERGASPNGLRVVAGSPEVPEDLRLALGDIVLSVAAVDGTIAFPQDASLHVTPSIRGLIGRRVLAADSSPAVAEALATGQTRWVEDRVSAGVHLPPRVEVLAVPFTCAGVKAVALLSFHHRRHLSGSDVAWVTHVLTSAAARSERSPRAVTRRVAA